MVIRQVGEQDVELPASRAAVARAALRPSDVPESQARIRSFRSGPPQGGLATTAPVPRRSRGRPCRVHRPGLFRREPGYDPIHPRPGGCHDVDVHFSGGACLATERARSTLEVPQPSPRNIGGGSGRSLSPPRPRRSIRSSDRGPCGALGDERHADPCGDVLPSKNDTRLAPDDSGALNFTRIRRGIFFPS